MGLMTVHRCLIYQTWYYELYYEFKISEWQNETKSYPKLKYPLIQLFAGHPSSAEKSNCLISKKTKGKILAVRLVLFKIVTGWNFLFKFLPLTMLQVLCVLPFQMYKLVIFVKYRKQISVTEWWGENCPMGKATCIKPAVQSALFWPFFLSFTSFACEMHDTAASITLTVPCYADQLY